MLPILERIDPNSSELDLLVELVAALRPRHADETALQAVRTLCQLLLGNPLQAHRLRRHLVCVLQSRRHTSLYTDIGIHSNNGFFSELLRHITYCILPPALEKTYLSDALDQILYVKTDYRWIAAVPMAQWLVLCEIVQQADGGAQAEPVCSNKNLSTPAIQTASKNLFLPGILEAIRTLSYRICAIGLEPQLVRIHTEIEKYESPFLMQNIEVNAIFAAYTANEEQSGIEYAAAIDSKHLLVMLDQCQTVIGKIRNKALLHGTSIALSYLLVVLTQSIIRMQKLLFLLTEPEIGADVKQPSAAPEQSLCMHAVNDLPVVDARREAAGRLVLELIEAHNKKYDLGQLFANNFSLLARNITENASRTGEHYIAESRQVYRAMFLSSAGAGVIISVMAMCKILASYLRAAPLVEAFLFSMNYSLGFMLIHVLHFTVATKQPAMTAARIAAGLHSKDGRHIDLESMSELIVKVWRTQFVAVLGNLVTAMPFAYLLALSYRAIFGHHLVSAEKAQHLLHEIDPFHSLALWYAMIAGVCLFVAGLVSGYYDNRALYTHFAARITQLRLLGRLLGENRHQRLAIYLENNLGGLMSNFYFGIFLGSAATLGDLLGLPIDIRHVTFSSTNFATSVVGLDHHLSWQQVLISLVGILAIGCMNLFVSFGLALVVALRSRGARFERAPLLLKILAQRFVHRPKDFFVAPVPVIPPENTAMNPTVGQSSKDDQS